MSWFGKEASNYCITCYNSNGCLFFSIRDNIKEYWLALYNKHLPACTSRSIFQVGRSRSSYSAKSLIPFLCSLVINSINVVKSWQFFYLKWGFYFMVGSMVLGAVFWAIEFRAGFELLPVCKVLILGGALFCR